MKDIGVPTVGVCAVGPALAVGATETVKLTELVVDGTELLASLTEKTTLAVL